MDLFERVSEDIKNAMKAKDKVALETLRNVKKFFLEAKTAPGANDTLTDADALKAIIAQVGATGPKDMGNVMGIASKALAGKAEGRMISEVVKKLLN